MKLDTWLCGTFGEKWCKYLYKNGLSESLKKCKNRHFLAFFARNFKKMEEICKNAHFEVIFEQVIFESSSLRFEVRTGLVFDILATFTLDILAIIYPQP